MLLLRGVAFLGVGVCLLRRVRLVVGLVVVGLVVVVTLALGLQAQLDAVAVGWAE